MSSVIATILPEPGRWLWYLIFLRWCGGGSVFQNRRIGLIVIGDAAYRRLSLLNIDMYACHLIAGRNVRCIVSNPPVRRKVHFSYRLSSICCYVLVPDGVETSWHVETVTKGVASAICRHISHLLKRSNCGTRSSFAACSCASLFCSSWNMMYVTSRKELQMKPFSNYHYFSSFLESFCISCPIFVQRL